MTDSIGKIEIIDEKNGKFIFNNKDWKAEEQMFKIFELDKTWDELAKKCFSKFGGAKSPYENWDKTKNLEISDSMADKMNFIRWYVESILLHELMDHDDNKDSMLKSEEYVIKKINNSKDLDESEKHRIINAHLWFFQWNKDFYKELFKKFKEYYKENEEEFLQTKQHYDKICDVVDYLDWILKE